jgi:hypothetical protein
VTREVHFVCQTCDAVVPSARCPAEGHWLEARLGRGAHRVLRCSGERLADRIGFDAARNVTMRYSLGLWTDQDLLDHMAELEARRDVLKRRVE